MNEHYVRVWNLETEEEYTNSIDKGGLLSAKGAYYWFSLDSQNQILSAGIGEPRTETMNLYHHAFPQNDESLRKQNKAWLESIRHIEICNNSIGIVKPLRILKDPITGSIPLVVKNTDELSMMDIAKGTYMPKANLPIVCQKLYDCIAGKRFVLDDEDFPDFSKAIEYSIATPGKWCNTTLKNKSTEFNKDKPNLLETYLRITLGQNNGESPGIPYVMEIWPVGHYSPIHSHANANAIIRVLHGQIHVKLYPFLCTGKEGIVPFAETDFSKDEITWITPALNETHQLVNLDTNTETCITIQCYMYDETNKAHYDYFDYIDESGKKQQYEPDSDMDFVQFKHLMKEEWMAREIDH